MKLTSAISALLTVALVTATDPRVLADADVIVARDATIAPCEPGKFDCAQPQNEKRQGLIGFQCYPWMACWPHGPKEVIDELETKNKGVEKRQGLIGFQCHPWYKCCPPCPEDLANATEEVETKSDGVEKRQGLIGFQCYPWMACWPHGEEAEQQASA